MDNFTTCEWFSFSWPFKWTVGSLFSEFSNFRCAHSSLHWIWINLINQWRYEFFCWCCLSVPFLSLLHPTSLIFKPNFFTPFPHPPTWYEKCKLTCTSSWYCYLYQNQKWDFLYNDDHKMKKMQRGGWGRQILLNLKVCHLSKDITLVQIN
jgi:hypothetical protein